MEYGFKTITNKFPIKIEGKIYFIYESYIVNGSGYTFTIYKSSKMCYLRKNYYYVGSNISKIVIVGKKYNYILIKDKDKFEFNIIKYKKNILKCVSESFPYEHHSIYLNNEEISTYFGTDPLFENDMILCKNIIRKEKITKITNE